MLDTRQIVKSEIDDLPENCLEEVFDFIKFLKEKSRLASSAELLNASESSLMKDWLKREEEEAWKHL